MSSGKVKVLQIIKSLGRGGAETLLVQTLKIHDQHAFEFHYIYFLPWKNQLADELKLFGGKVSCIPANNNIQLLLQVRKVAAYVKEHKIQLIHAHLPWAGLLARMVGRITGVPVLYTEHNKQERYHIATRMLNLLTMNWLSAIIPVSKDVESSIRKHKKGLTIPVQTILNGVNTSHFQPDLLRGKEVRKKYGIADDAIVITTIAVFRFQKRLDVWLEIAKQVLDQNPTARFIIVGDGPLKQQLLDKQKQLGLEQTVHFAGLQTEVRPFISATDIYMMTSIFEGLPIALLEAMASGLPVVSTDAGGIKEVIADGEDGLLCPVDDPFRLVHYCNMLINDPARRGQISEAARRKILKEFSMENMVSQLEHLYTSVMQQQHN